MWLVGEWRHSKVVVTIGEFQMECFEKQIFDREILFSLLD